MRGWVVVSTILVASVQTGCPYLIDNAAELSIELNFETDFERDLISTAELLCPDRDAVLAVASPEVLIDPPDESECLWWQSVSEGRRWPYAITGDMIDYYTGLVNALLPGGSEFEGDPPIVSRFFHYSATVSRSQVITLGDETIQGGYIVEMSAYWSEGARFASNGFSIDRLVVFSDVGDPIGVYYDGSFRRIVPVSK